MFGSLSILEVYLDTYLYLIFIKYKILIRPIILGKKKSATRSFKIT